MILLNIDIRAKLFSWLVAVGGVIVGGAGMTAAATFRLVFVLFNFFKRSSDLIIRTSA